MVGLLIELFLLLCVVLVQLDSDELQDLAHEFLLVEFKCLQKQYYQLYETVNEVVVQQGVGLTQLPRLGLS